MNYRSMFQSVRTIAVIGLSDNPERPSFQVASYLKEKGYTIIPINPNLTEVLGEKAYPSLHDVPQDIIIDAVDVFRKSSEVLVHAEETVRRGGVKLLWFQEGIQNEEAEQYARDHGITVVSNACMMKAHFPS